MIGMSPCGRPLRMGVACSLSLLTVTACASKQTKPTRPTIPVMVAPARRMAVPYNVTANGMVTPLQTASVAAQVDGLVTRVTFQEGQDVTKGQVLFQIDPRPYRAAYAQAEAMLARDAATAANNQREVQRYDKLVQQDYVTHEQADQVRATAVSAQATLQADSAAVATAKFNLDNTTIRAPISGRTGSLLVRVGNLVHGSAATPLVVINQIKPIFVRFAVPSTQLPAIQRYGGRGGLAIIAAPGVDPSQSGGDTATTSDSSAPATPATNVPAAPPQIGTMRSAKGTLTFIDNAVDTTTGTVILKGTFPNTDERLWAGEFAAVSMQLYVEQNALVVPAQAVTVGQQGAYVYVIDSSGKAQQRPVKMERSAGNLVVISSGLKDGERVVTDGQSRLTPGSKVTVRTAADTATGKGGASGAGGKGTQKGHGHRQAQ